MIASLLKWFGRLAGIRPDTRLDEDRVLEIAQAYSDAHGLAWERLTLYVQDVRPADDRLIWTLRTATKGSWLTVEIDDAAGEVLSHQRHGIR